MSMPREDLPLCDCRWLENAAHDPDNPIEFDPKLNEYNLKTPRGRSLRIYHCPFCAGRAPESLRGQMFATVSDEESRRLHNLIKDLKTEEDVIAKLGEPTDVIEPGATRTEPEKDGKPGEIHTYKTLRYVALSHTAVVEAHIDRRGNAWISLFGKYIGKARET